MWVHRCFIGASLCNAWGACPYRVHAFLVTGASDVSWIGCACTGLRLNSLVVFTLEAFNRPVYHQFKVDTPKTVASMKNKGVLAIALMALLMASYISEGALPLIQPFGFDCHAIGARVGRFLGREGRSRAGAPARAESSFFFLKARPAASLDSFERSSDSLPVCSICDAAEVRRPRTLSSRPRTVPATAARCMQRMHYGIQGMQLVYYCVCIAIMFHTYAGRWKSPPRRRSSFRSPRRRSSRRSPPRRSPYRRG